MKIFTFHNNRLVLGERQQKLISLSKVSYYVTFG